MVSSEILVVGGGVVGLSIAWELSRRGAEVVVVDRGPKDGGASWAGGGMLPPALLDTALHPVERLRGLANRLHPQWARTLQEITGIDTGFRRCGALHVARTAGEAAALAGAESLFREAHIAWQRIALDECREWEPELVADPPLRAVYRAPEESQLRNPRHLRALAAACRQSGGRLVQDEVVAVESVEGVPHVVGKRETYSGRSVCLTLGAWTGPLLEKAGFSNGIYPVRGQMVLYRGETRLLRHIVIEGTRYLIPRDDGRLLVGSTEEEVGFDWRTSESAIGDLIAFAQSLVPALRSFPIERTWAGLRPASFDGLPYMGPLPGWRRTFVAAGHFRHGLSLSPAIALVMADLIEGRRPPIELEPFALLRA